MALKFDCRPGPDEVLLRVSTRILHRAFMATASPALTQLHPGKIAQLMQCEVPLRAPRVAAYQGKLGFINGRHRTRAALLQGRKVLPISGRAVTRSDRMRIIRSKPPGKPSKITCTGCGRKAPEAGIAVKEEDIEEGWMSGVDGDIGRPMKSFDWDKAFPLCEECVTALEKTR